MNTTMQIIQWKNWKVTATILLLGLALSALTSVVKVANAAPKTWIPSQAVSDYTDFAGVASYLTHQAPGTVANGTTIAWGLTSEGKAAYVQLDDYVMGINVYINLDRTQAGQYITAIRVSGLGGPPGGPWWHHSTDWIPCTPVAFNLATGFTIHVHQDNIPVYRHATQKPNSPRVEIAGAMALGDLMIYPTP